MGDEAQLNGANDDDHSRVVDIYPLSCYYFGTKEAVAFGDETLADRVLRMKAK